MENIHLSSITDDHVNGRWEVKTRLFTKTTQINPFSDTNLIEIQNGLYKSLNGKEIGGKLQVLREHEIIYNPQLVFYINENKVANAIITRLITEKEGDKMIYNLTLYFTTGLELVLQKTHNN